MRRYPQFSFWISIALVNIRFPRIVINTSLLVGTVFNVAENSLPWESFLAENELLPQLAGTRHHNDDEGPRQQ